MEVLDAARMRRADEVTIRTIGIPGLVLMENAGRLAAEVLADEVPGLAGRRVVVFAGRGNNGGDGFVVARHLALRGVAVEVALIGAKRGDLAGDAAAMCAAWRGLGGTLVELPDAAAWARRAPALGPGDVAVDALFGTGLTRPLDGLAAVVVDALNAADAFVCALDVPSGLFASSAALPGPAVRADLTVTFARPKPAHLLLPAEDCCGDVIVVDIGIPDGVVREIGSDLHWVTADDASQLLPERDASEHKGRFGHVLVVAGSVGKSGAAGLAGLGALRAGAGLVTLACPAPARAEAAAFAPELMSEALPAAKDGALARGAAGAALKLLASRSVLALGPGLGQSAAVQAEVRRLVAASPVPVVLDADGLNAFAGQPKTLAKRKAALVITPHPGEAARLLDCSVPEVEADRLAAARRLAREADAVAVLKGHRTVIAAPDGVAFLNSTGNPGMATGGMGDVLTGLIAGLLAQHAEPLDAAVLGVYLHGLAADLAVDEGDESEESLVASAVLAHLGWAFDRLAASDDDDGAAERTDA